jgi:poly-beta-1,6-N-acetyl-D-glucosamine N-deacetylase
MFLTLMLLAFLLNTTSAYAEEPPERIIAAQVFRSDARNIQEFEEEIGRMKGLGINTVIFRVFGNKGDRVYAFANPKTAEGVYFKTKVSPVIDDILGVVTDAAHKHRIKIFAWMTTRHATYGGDATLLDSEYSFSRKKVKSVPKLDLFNDKAVRYLEALYKDLAAYPVDGVLIQDDFVMRHMEGFGQAASATYSRQFGKALDAKSMFSDFELKPDGRVKRIVYTQEFWDFTGWKNTRLRAVAKGLIKSLREARPGIEVALNVSYELFQKPQNALAWFAHDWALARQFDYAAVMSYQEQIKKELGIDLNQAGALIEDNAATAIKVMGSPEKVIMKIQTIDWDTRRPLPHREVRYIYHKLHSASPDVGIALVPWEGNEKFRFLESD